MHHQTIESYMQAVKTHAFYPWTGELGRASARLEKTFKQLAKLKAIKKPSDSDKEWIEIHMKSAKESKSLANDANGMLYNHLMDIKVWWDMDEKEMKRIPVWLKELLKAGGSRLGKYATLKVEADINVEKAVLKGLSIEFINWKF